MITEQILCYSENESDVNNLWQWAGRFSEAGFKHKDVEGRVQNNSAHAIATKWGIDQANQNSDKRSLAVSHDKSQKASRFRVCTAMVDPLSLF